MYTKMKSVHLILSGIFLIAGSLVSAGDVYLNDGLSYQINYTVDGSLWIENASVSMYNPARITGFAITGSGSVLDIYGGQIDYMLLVSTSDNGMPDGLVTIYGTDFAVDGVPVAPDTPELYLSNKTLTGVYEDGTPFTIVVDCAVSGNATYLHYQTLKLGWVVIEPNIETSYLDYDFQQVDIGSTGLGTVTVYNTGNANLTLQSISVVQDEPAQFGFTPLQVIPMTLEPGASVDVEIYFAPAVEGAAEAVLEIASSDPDTSVLSIALTGTGAAVQVSSRQQAQAIVDFCRQAMAAGTIEGVGKNKAASNKAKAFFKMLKACEQLIDAGYYDYAREALACVAKKCDGKKAPADFVKGGDVPALHAMMKDLMASLNGL